MSDNTNKKMENVGEELKREAEVVLEAVEGESVPQEPLPGQEDYKTNFMPAVHRIGRITMTIAFALVFFPVIYFFFVKGYQLPVTNYLNVMVAIGAIGIGMWLTEPLAYWPVLGSAGTYIAYLSGNVSGMRFPVALSVQSANNADINTPKGQVITIIGIVASVFCNLVILLAIVLGGQWLLSVLPEPVLAAFSYVMPCLFGCMLIMRFASGKEGFGKTMLSCLPYLATAIGTKLIIAYLLPVILPASVAQFFSFLGTAFAVGLTVLVAYILYRVRLGKNAEAKA